MEFKEFRVITNGEKFRIEGKYETVGHGDKWIHLSRQYYGCDFVGMIPIGELEFDSKQEAVDYIVKEWGQDGKKKFSNSWHPC